MTTATDDQSVAQRVLDHIANGTTDLGQTVWREPVANYRSPDRLKGEIETVLRRTPTAFCPSAALPEVGSYVAREAAGIPIVAVRGSDGKVRAFRNACRHRGMQVATGSGCARAFVCRYHGWTYSLEGRLRHIPHEEGFPGFDKETHPLVPVRAVERLGLVFVTQDEPARADDALDASTS
jgi:phenylpropionate dioxygenase-like ring-hydroxylating dioxygenase large terminal subunit